MMIAEKNTELIHTLQEICAGSGKSSFVSMNELADALRSLEENGIPNSRHEDYKYCNLEAILKKEFKGMSGEFDPVSEKQLAQFLNQESEDTYTVVIGNGKTIQHNLPKELFDKGLIVCSFDQAYLHHRSILNAYLGKIALNPSDSLLSLNLAYMAGGLLLFVPEGMQLDKPVRLKHIYTNNQKAFLNSRQLIIASAHTVINVLFDSNRNETNKNLFVNLVTEIYGHASSQVSVTDLQKGDEGFYQVHHCYSTIENLAQLNHFMLNLPSSLLRNNTHVFISGEHAEAHLIGLSLPGETSLIDNHTRVVHGVPNCVSNELYKGVVKGKSTLVFNGKIFVERHAQKTNAYQSSKTILLSDDATVNTKPELEIYANDVKCSHGTSTGKLDPEALFYLQSRGIGMEAATKLLLSAFCLETVEKIQQPDIKREVEACLESYF